MTGQDRPNFLVVVFDSLGAQELSALADKLPTLSGLQQTSICFSNAYAPSPESGPARASLFTGLDMAAHGVWTDGVALPDTERTFPERMMECGYRTWLVGRRHLAGVSNWTTEHARPNEYAQFQWAHGPLHRSLQNAYLIWLQTTAPDTYYGIFPSQANADDTVIPAIQHDAMAAIPDDLSFNTWVGLQSTNCLIDHAGQNPFLGVVGFVVGDRMGSDPSDGSICEPLNARALQQADAAIGDLLNTLASKGLADTTTLVITAARGSASPLTPGQALQENAVKVPLMIRIPNGAARAVDAITSTVNIAPTLYDLAHVPVPTRTQGVNLLTQDATNTPLGWALSRLRHPAQTWQTALHTAQLKLVVSHGTPDAGIPPSYRLFDLRADPGETTDLAPAAAHQTNLENMLDLAIDARVALEDRTEPRIAKF